MSLKQGDLFWGMDKEFVKEAMDTTTKQNPNEGDLLFREGDAADYFYIIIKTDSYHCVSSCNPILEGGIRDFTACIDIPYRAENSKSKHRRKPGC